MYREYKKQHDAFHAAAGVKSAAVVPDSDEDVDMDTDLNAEPAAAASDDEGSADRPPGSAQAIPAPDAGQDAAALKSGSEMTPIPSSSRSELTRADGN